MNKESRRLQFRFLVNWPASLLLAALCGCAVTPAPVPQAANGAGPSAPTGVERLERLYAEDPGQLHLAYSLASQEAQAGRVEAALRWLERLDRGGWELGVLPDDLGPLAGDPRLSPVLRRLRERVRSTTVSDEAFRLPERDLIPEGIAHDPRSGDFFVGSLRHHKIVRVSPAGEATELVAPGSGGLGPVLGLEVDPERRRLWAASSGPAAAGTGGSALYAFDTDSGALIGRYPLDNGAEGELNDLCLAPSGAVYATDSGTGAVVTLAPGASSLAQLVPPGRLSAPNGIVCWPRGDRLIVADALGLSAVDISGGTVRRLATPAGTLVAGIDGLDLHGDTLVGVQNAFGLGRVLAIRLDPEAERILEVRPLETANPSFDIPTTGTVVGELFYYIGNSQLLHLNPAGDLLRPEELAETLILRLRLPD